MFDLQPDIPWWRQPRLFLYFLAVSGIVMASLGFFIYYHFSDVYPYDLIALSCLTEAAIYMRFLRMIVCPTQIFVAVAYQAAWFIRGISFPLDFVVLYKSFETVIVMFAAQIYAFAFINLSLQLFICVDLYLTLKDPFYPRQRRGRCQYFI